MCIASRFNGCNLSGCYLAMRRVSLPYGKRPTPPCRSATRISTCPSFSCYLAGPRRHGLNTPLHVATPCCTPQVGDTGFDLSSCYLADPWFTVAAIGKALASSSARPLRATMDGHRKVLQYVLLSGGSL